MCFHHHTCFLYIIDYRDIEAVIQFQNIDEVEKQIYFDPQTSGGLLLSVSPESAQGILKKLKLAFPKTNIVGSVEKQSELYVYVE